jgi:predicted metal-dependent hydrolase
MTDLPTSDPASSTPQPDAMRGRTPPLDQAEADRLFNEGLSLFNGVRYWHAHEAWETLWRAADDDERPFYQGLIQVAAGLLHLQRRNARGALNKLEEGIAKLRPFEPAHGGIGVSELIGRVERIIRDLRSGQLPYLIPPVIRHVGLDEHDWRR